MSLPLQHLWHERADHWRFFQQWLRHPLTTAAITPSGRQLVRCMMDEVPIGAQRVIELGAGTGVMTRALIAHGVEPANLLTVEMNADLASHLRTAFPAAHVLCADACRLPELAAGIGYLAEAPADTVVSSLGLLSMSSRLQRDILSAAFACMKPDGRFIQFTYGPRPPVRRDVANELGLHARRCATVFRNLPPATVFVYTRSRSRALVPRQAR